MSLFDKKHIVSQSDALPGRNTPMPVATLNVVTEHSMTHVPSAWPEVVFCAGLPMSVGIYHVLQKRGVRVPQDISLMTTYVWELDAPMRNETTGIAIPCRALGIEAVHLLQTRLNRPNAPVFNLLLQGKVYDLGSVTHATRHAARVSVSR